MTHSELRNVSEYDAKGISIGAGFNAGKNDAQGQKQPDTVLSKSNKIDGHASSQVGVSKSIGFGLDSDKDSSVTKSGVNTKNITITNEAGQQQLTGKTAEQLKSEILTDVTTDTARENSGALNNVFDKDKVQKEINLQMDVTKKFDANRQEAKAEINKQIDELKAAGKDASQWQKAGVLLDMVSAGLSAPTASGAGIAASTLSPAASYEIGQYFKGKDAETIICEGYIYSEFNSYSFEWVTKENKIGWFDMNEIPHGIGQEIIILMSELRSLDSFKEKWTNFKVTLTDTGKFNIEFAYIPEEDHWPSLSMRGISDLSEEELDRDYSQIPKELWEERVRIKNQNQ